MLTEQWAAAVGALNLEDCKDLIRLARRRIGSLVESPSADIAAKCAPGRTVSIEHEGMLVTGVVEEVTGSCLSMRFASGEVALATMDRLDPEGFGLEPTDLPPRAVERLTHMDAEAARPASEKLPVVFGGRLYLPDKEGPAVTQARRVLVSVIPEALPTRRIRRLELAGVGGGLGLCV